MHANAHTAHMHVSLRHYSYFSLGKQPKSTPLLPAGIVEFY